MDKAREEHLLLAGIDCIEGVKRSNDSETLYLKFLNKFLNDKNYTLLLQEIEGGRWEDAAIYAHALKGLSANLGMMELCRESVRAEADVRAGTVPANLESLANCYGRITDAILHLADM